MAIDKGIAISCADLQQVGGIKHILLRDWATGDVVTYDSSDDHAISSIVDTGGSTADWYLYEFKSQEASMSINATKENGSTAFECGLSFMLPKLEVGKANVIQDLLESCLMIIAVDTNDKAFVLGVSQKYRNESEASRSQTFGNFASAEGGTGAAYSDESGITISLMARQFEMPREYVVTAPQAGITVGATGLTATTD